MNVLRDFQDAESVRSGHFHVTSQPVSFPPHPVPGGMLSLSIGMPSRNDGPPSVWDTHGISGNVFCKSNGVFFSTLSAGIDKIRDASLDRQPKVQSSLVRETLERIMGQTNNDCRFGIFTLTSSLRQRPLLVGI